MNDGRRHFDGEDPREYHARKMGLKCTKCGRLAYTTAKTFLRVCDVPAHTMAQMFMQHGGELPFVDMADGQKYVRVGMAHACDECRKEMEQTAARAPSYAVVVIEGGPAKYKPLIAVE